MTNFNLVDDFLTTCDLFWRNRFARWVGYWERREIESKYLLESIFCLLVFLLIGGAVMLIWIARYDD